MGNIWVNPKASGIVSPFPFTSRFQEPFWGQKNQKSRETRDFFVGIFLLANEENSARNYRMEEKNDR